MTTELGRLVNDLIEAAQAYSKTKGYIGSFDALNAQVAAETALVEYVEKREAELAKLREGAERIAADYDGTGYKVTRELRALLK